jgi:hypothetical protein
LQQAWHWSLLGAAAWPVESLCAREMRRNDIVLAPPTVAHRLTEGRLAVRIDAWVFERESIRTRTRLLAKVLGIDLDDIAPADRRRFEQRAALFGTDGESGRDLLLESAGQAPTALPPTDAQGRLQTLATLPAGGAPGAWLDLVLASGSHRAALAAQWLGDEGLSVVSDIDDTIKHTQVRQWREMLLNTFARPFAAVAGMADWYARIAAGNAAASFHYVSGSPWQLMAPLLAFLNDGAFPRGSLHPRLFSLRPDALLDKEATARHKNETIAQLLADHPQRRFLLVGDSGEHDPEIYGVLMRAHPSRIVATLIRDVTGEDAGGARYASAFADVPAERWKLFTDASAMPGRWP